MSSLTPVFLTIHILTAIGAFGPTFAFPLMASMAAREPQHGLFVLRLTDKIEKRMVLPLAMTMPVSGGLLIWSEGLTLQGSHWLVAAIALYLFAITYAVFVQVRTIDRMIELAEGMAGVRRPEPGAMQPSFAAGPGAALATAETMDAGRAAAGAEMARLGARVRNGGILLTILIFAIVSLMAGKPTL
jgi:uncharacterized membrane protein